MRKFILIIALCFDMAHAEVHSEPLLSTPHAEGTTKTLSVRFPPPPEENSSAERGAAIWTYSTKQPGSRSLQLHFKNMSYDPEDFFEIDVVNARGDVIQTLSNKTMNDRKDFWTDITSGSSIGLSIYGNRKGKLRFELDRLAFDRLGMVLESIIGEDGREHLYEYDRDLLPVVNAVRGGVAKLAFIAQTPTGEKRYVCTGFLINDDTLVTNEHCVADDARCRSTKIIFGFAYNQLGQTPGQEQFDCQEVLAANVPLDMAVLKVAGKPGRRWGSLNLSGTNVLKDQRIFVIQHPAGEAKQISEVDCVVFEAVSPGRNGDTDFAHKCDTLGGSSGSPIFSVAGEVVGLHHWGRESFGKYAQANRAVQMTQILPLLEPFLNRDDQEPPQPEAPDGSGDSGAATAQPTTTTSTPSNQGN